MAYDKVVDSAALDASLTAIADAIREKTGKADAMTLDQMATEIEGISAGGGSTEEWIGDGNTHIWITLPEGRTSPMLGVCPKGTVTVDWGDGTAPDTLTGTSLTSVKQTPQHNYASAGDYVITLTVDGEVGFYGDDYGPYLLRTANPNSSVYRIAIKRVEMGTGVTSIGLRSFYNCYGLESVIIPEGVTSIGNLAFNGCSSLESVIIPEGVTSIGNEAFCNCYSLNSVIIPEGATLVGSSTFENCHGLKSVTIPSSVTSIVTDAFYSCYSLNSVTIPEGVTSIGNTAFNRCFGLASVTIPSSVTSIGSSAFSICSGLAKVRFDGATPPTISSSSAFSSLAQDCVISVPVGCLDAYKTATNYPSASTYAYVEE